MLKCAAGYDLIGADDRGCGGKCVEKETPTTCMACLIAGQKWSVGACRPMQGGLKSGLPPDGATRQAPA